MESRPRIRTLGPGRDEREAVLGLLDGWPFDDGRRGRDFFRRYFERDPGFAPGNVWIAEEGGRPVACVQVFPRRLRIAAASTQTLPSVPIGGIGSVFTAPGHRRRGLATQLLRAALAQMVDRGMVLSLLLATRLDWYRRLGFVPWCDERWRLRGGEGVGSGDSRFAIATIDPQDLDEVSDLGDRYALRRPGTVARTPVEWRASLDLAGDPDEDFSVARSGGRIVAYLRCAALDGRWQALEWGREPEGDPAQKKSSERAAGAPAAALAVLFAEALGRAPRGDASGLGAPPLRDDAVEQELAARGLKLEREPWVGSAPPPTWMLCCLAPQALAPQLGEESPPDGDPLELLQRVLPRERFGFWPSDRF